MASTTKKPCARCQRTVPHTNFYKVKEANEEFPDGYLSVCKDCLGNVFKSTEPGTFMYILRAIDIPWIPCEYRNVQQKNATAQNPNKITILGKYIMKMKLVQFKSFGFFDSEAAQAKFEQEPYWDSIENYNYSLPIDTVPSSSDLRGDPLIGASIPRPQDAPAGEVLRVMGEGFDKSFLMGGPSAAAIAAPELLPGVDYQLPEANLEFELDETELRYLVAKWGPTYNRSQLISLERKYVEMCEDYDIRTSSHKDYLTKYCQCSLRYDELLGAADLEGARKASTMYSSINKDAGFQPIQDKEQENDYLNAVSFLVKLAEEQGPIPRYDNSADPDIVDITLKDIKLWQKSLVEDDDTLLDRYALAKEELARQDELVHREDYEDDDEPLYGVDTGVYNSLDEEVLSDWK